MYVNQLKSRQMKIKRNRIKVLNILLFLAISLCLILQSCSPNKQTLRIKTDKSSNQEAPLNSKDTLTTETTEKSPINPQKKQEYPPNQTEKTTFMVITLLITAQEQIQKGKLDDAEKSVIKGLSYIENLELLMLLNEVYQMKGDLSKADSCMNVIEAWKDEF